MWTTAIFLALYGTVLANPQSSDGRFWSAWLSNQRQPVYYQRPPGMGQLGNSGSVTGFDSFGIPGVVPQRPPSGNFYQRPDFVQQFNDGSRGGQGFQDGLGSVGDSRLRGFQNGFGSAGDSRLRGSQNGFGSAADASLRGIPSWNVRPGIQDSFGSSSLLNDGIASSNGFGAQSRPVSGNIRSPDEFRSSSVYETQSNGRATTVDGLGVRPASRSDTSNGESGGDASLRGIPSWNARPGIQDSFGSSSLLNDGIASSNGFGAQSHPVSGNIRSPDEFRSSSVYGSESNDRATTGDSLSVRPPSRSETSNGESVGDAKLRGISSSNDRPQIQDSYGPLGLSNDGTPSSNGFGVQKLPRSGDVGSPDELKSSSASESQTLLLPNGRATTGNDLGVHSESRSEISNGGAVSQDGLEKQ